MRIRGITEPWSPGSSERSTIRSAWLVWHPVQRIWAIQVTNNHGVITDGALLCAVDWVTAHASTIEVANMSLGGPDPATDNCGIAPRKQDGDALHAAICASVAAGVTYVVSAGNDSVDAGGVTPASYPEVITVSAMADSDGVSGGTGPALGNQPPLATSRVRSRASR